MHWEVKETKTHHKISIPHIHKIEGEAGFWAKVAKTGKVEEIKFQTLLGLRQIEGILVGRRVTDVPIVVSRICGICPVPHILCAIGAIEKALDIKTSIQTNLFRKLLLAANIIHSHTLHLFFLSLPDFLNLDNDLELTKRFKKETKAALKIRNFALEITRAIGGRVVHPITPRIGGFSRLPTKAKLKQILNKAEEARECSILLVDIFKKIEYPNLEKKSVFVSTFSNKDYSFYLENFIKSGKEKFTVGDFYSTKIEEDLKNPPVKKVKLKGDAYMVGAIARLKNNESFLKVFAKEKLEQFRKERKISKENFLKNTFYNLFSQAIEVLHFLDITTDLIKTILELPPIEGNIDIKPKLSSGLAALEAPRGTLFHYYEINKQGRIANCNIITPTAQFLHNIEEDLKVFLPEILNLKKEEKIKKIRSLIRVYDPCISCATH